MGETETKESFDMKNYVSPVKKKNWEIPRKVFRMWWFWEYKMGFL